MAVTNDQVAALRAWLTARTYGESVLTTSTFTSSASKAVRK